MAGLIVQRKQRTTQEIQLKEKTEGTDEILNITNLAIVLDQGLSPLSAALSTFLNSYNPYMPSGRRFFIYFAQHSVGSLRDKSTNLMYLWVLPFRHTGKLYLKWQKQRPFQSFLGYQKELKNFKNRTAVN